MVTQRNDLLCVASPLTNETENLEVAFKRVPVHSQEITCLSYFLSSLSRRLGDRAFLRPAFSLTIFSCAKQEKGGLGPWPLL